MSLNISPATTRQGEFQVRKYQPGLVLLALVVALPQKQNLRCFLYNNIPLESFMVTLLLICYNHDSILAWELVDTPDILTLFDVCSCRGLTTLTQARWCGIEVSSKPFDSESALMLTYISRSIQGPLKGSTCAGEWRRHHINVSSTNIILVEHINLCTIYCKAHSHVLLWGLFVF